MDPNGTHVAVGGAAVAGSAGIVQQIAQIMVGHGVDAALAYNEAGLLVTAVGALGAMLWNIYKLRYPSAAAEVQPIAGELLSYEQTHQSMAEAVVDEMEHRGSVKNAMALLAGLPLPSPTKARVEPTIGPDTPPAVTPVAAPPAPVATPAAAPAPVPPPGT